jgi:hypothetical protein
MALAIGQTSVRSTVPFLMSTCVTLIKKLANPLYLVAAILQATNDPGNDAVN